MILSVTTNTQAILLLTAPLITGKNGGTGDEVLSPGEYRQFARQLRELGHEPGDLLGTASSELVRELDSIVRAERIRRLLDRSFLVSQAIERWQSRAIWVLSRADAEYPRRIKNRLKENSPAVLYGCGESRLLESGGLAIVGSRHADEKLVEYAEAAGRHCADARQNVVSGAAIGIDRAAMRGALSAGGCAIGVLAEGLERAALSRENRDLLLDGRLVLVSPYDPNAGFNVGHAMQRNKIIYALADAALIVSADYEKGGTWAGATEQLRDLHFVSVFVRSTGELGPGLEGLRRLGARLWPNPEDASQWSLVFETAPMGSMSEQMMFQHNNIVGTANPTLVAANDPEGHAIDLADRDSTESELNGRREGTGNSFVRNSFSDTPADALVARVREILTGILTVPKTEHQIASLLQVSNSQARVWLEKLVKEGALEKKKRPVCYQVKQQMLI